MFGWQRAILMGTGLSFVNGNEESLACEGLNRKSAALTQSFSLRQRCVLCV